VDATAQAPVAEDVLHRGKLELDAQRMTVRWNGAPVGLTVTEFWMVHSLARHPGHVKDRDQLMRDAEMVVDDGTITSHIKRIRKKFLAIDPAFAAIDTVYGMGYRWVEGA
jgi:two-component system OmpR family response regulator